MVGNSFVSCSSDISRLSDISAAGGGGEGFSTSEDNEIIRMGASQSNAAKLILPSPKSFNLEYHLKELGAGRKAGDDAP